MNTTSSDVIYREVQLFRKTWIWIPVLIVAGIAWYGFVRQIVFAKPFGAHPAPDGVVWIICFVFGVGLPLFFYSLKLIVEISGQEIRIRLFLVSRRTILLHDIASCEVCRYRPFLDYGGWGIRWSPTKGWAYNVSGSLGVRLELVDGKRILIGSQRAEELAQIIKEALRR